MALVPRYKVCNTNLLQTKVQFVYQRPVDSKYTAPKPSGNTTTGGNVEASSKAEDDRSTGNAADDLGQPASVTN